MNYAWTVTALPLSKMGWRHIPDLLSSVMQDPSGRSGGGEDLPKELLPPLSLQTWHVEPTDDAQTHVTLSHTCSCTMTTVAVVRATATRALYSEIEIPRC